MIASYTHNDFSKVQSSSPDVLTHGGVGDKQPPNPFAMLIADAASSCSEAFLPALWEAITLHIGHT